MSLFVVILVLACIGHDSCVYIYIYICTYRTVTVFGPKYSNATNSMYNIAYSLRAVVSSTLSDPKYEIQLKFHQRGRRDPICYIYFLEPHAYRTTFYNNTNVNKYTG